VQAGDSASGIVSRIADRSTALWPAVDAIVTANPNAFVDGDMNRLIAGSVLQIPWLDSQQQLAGETADRTPAVAASSGADGDGARYASYDGYDAAVSAAVEVNESTASRIAPTLPQGEAAASGAAEQTGYASDAGLPSGGEAAILPVDTAGQTAANRAADRVTTAAPGDVFAGPDVPAAPTVNPPNVAGQAGDAPASTSSWLLWLGGSGIALILGLLLFGRKFRVIFGGAAENSLPPLHGTDDDSNAITQKSRVVADVDFRLDKQPGPGDRSIELDADLGIGTGLKSNGAIDLVQDFGFSGTIVEEGPLDLEIPEHAAAAGQSSSTDIIPPPHQARPETILESEVPPSEDDGDGDYDLSMIVDATKQAIHDQEGTTKDLMAVPVRTRTAMPDEQEYTLSKEIDYKILEQDYEDEITATQALNAEIARAALELTERMDLDEDSVMASKPSIDDITREMPVRQDPAITAELTAELPTDSEAENDAFISDLDDTGVNDELTISDDVTIEMDIETGTVDTKKIAG
jgi:hypothetical protein